MFTIGLIGHIASNSYILWSTTQMLPGKKRTVHGRNVNFRLEIDVYEVAEPFYRSPFLSPVCFGLISSNRCHFNLVFVLGGLQFLLSKNSIYTDTESNVSTQVSTEQHTSVCIWPQKMPMLYFHSIVLITF